MLKAQVPCLPPLCHARGPENQPRRRRRRLGCRGRTAGRARLDAAREEGGASNTTECSGRQVCLKDRAGPSLGDNAWEVALSPRPLPKWCQGCGLVNRSTNLYDDTFLRKAEPMKWKSLCPVSTLTGLGVCVSAGPGQLGAGTALRNRSKGIWASRGRRGREAETERKGRKQ